MLNLDCFQFQMLVSLLNMFEARPIRLSFSGVERFQGVLSQQIHWGGKICRNRGMGQNFMADFHIYAQMV